MNKRFAAVLAATAIAGVTTAFAANPFSDVTPSDWAYQAVSTLASQGVINGYPDGTFKGQNNITRYEMAQMIAKAMARQDRVSAEQGAMINRLANEFADELNNLGVRVTNLEKKVGNVRLTGDARLLYTDDESNEDVSSYQYRVRLGANAQVNERTVAGVRLVMENEFGRTSSDNPDFYEGSNNVKFDRAFVQHQFGDSVVATAGRQGMFVGQGLVYDDTFDGVAATAKLGALNLTAAHGYAILPGQDKDKTNTLVQLGAKVTDNVDAVGYWINGNENIDKDVYGAGLTAGFGKVTVDGEYAKAEDAGKAWTAGSTYGNYDQAVKGTWSLGARYLRSDADGPLSQYFASTTFDNPTTVDVKAWDVEANYALAKNLGLKGTYFFNQERIGGDDLDDAYRVELNYKF